MALIDYPLSEKHFDANASWLLRLRWIAVVGQLATIAAAKIFYNAHLPLTPLIIIVAIAAATNLGFWVLLRQLRRSSHRSVIGQHALLAMVMVLDLLLLTALLAFSGGLRNPFSVFYFVNISLSAVILPWRWSWLLTAFALSCFGVLFIVFRPLPELTPGGERFPIQLQGFAVAVAACATVTVYFITRITRELRIREDQLRVALEQQANSRRLESLATLAAGAGHELATPLSTIAVVTRELTNALEHADVSQTVISDVTLIRSEVDHCRRILDRMAGRAGQVVGEELVPINVTDLITAALAEMRTADRIKVEIDESLGQRRIRVPKQNMEQALRGILQNGLDASSAEQAVNLLAKPAGGGIELIVQDHGSGMPADVLARAGEPFFTTKDPDQGMGLGLFLSRTVIEMVEGRLTLESTADEGSTITIWLPSEDDDRVIQ